VPRTISDSDYVALAEIRYRIRSFLTFSEAAARGVGLEPKQHQLLLALRGLDADEAPTVGRVAQRLQIQPNSAVELVRRCVENGLLEKRADTGDRRVVHLRITRRGEKLLERLTQAHLTELRSMAPALTRMMSRLAAAEVA
jgi:DNA-binding MarR family transcriptional regulator